MQLIIDGLTAHTATWKRGIGKVFDQLLREILFYERSAEIVITCIGNALQNSLDDNLSNVTFRKIDPGIMVLSPEQRAAAYSAEIETISGESNDEVLFWHPNPLMPDQIVPYYSSVKMLMTIYDFIPYRHQELYLSKWPEEVRSEYLRRLRFFSQPNVHLAPISQTVASQVAELFPSAAKSCSPIAIGYDEKLFEPRACSNQQRAPYALLVGGDDPRKNMIKFAKAFCEWYQKGAVLNLKIVCRISDATRDKIMEIARLYRLDGVIEILGHVSDAYLGDLTKTAALAVMPSSDEGFGLPVLEAMACGVPVVSSDIPTSREIGGDLLYYFDPDKPESIVEALDAAAADIRADKIDHQGLSDRAAKFSWVSAGAGYRRRIAELMHSPSDLSKETRVAMLTPWPPQASGIAVSARALAKALASKVNLTVVTPAIQGTSKIENVALITPAEFAEDNYDLLICQIGNNLEMHSWIYNYALSAKSLSIVHDTFIHPFLQYGYKDGCLRDQYRSMLSNHFDAEVINGFERSNFADLDVLQLTGLSDLAKNTGAIHFHSRFARNSLYKELSNVECPVSVAPLVMKSPTDLDDTVLDTKGDRFVIGMFGHITRFKLPIEVLRAVHQLVLRGIPVELRVVGSLGDMEADMLSAIARMCLEDHVTIFGYVDEKVFLEQIGKCDVIVNLRYPTHGESSGVVFDAMAAGVPLIVSDNGSFADLPDCAVTKVAARFDTADELTDKLLQLLTSPELRKLNAARGKLFVQEAASLANYGESILQALTSIKFSHK